MVDEGNIFKFYTKVTSSHPQCCQCDVAGTSKNGEYYYVLESVISKSELAAVLAKTKIIFIAIGLIIILISAFFGKFLIGKLVRNIELAAEKVRAIRNGENAKGRVSIQGNDEVAYLTKEFDGLLDKLEESQEKIIESEKVDAKVQLAKEIAHNIKSPIIAVEMMLPMMINLPEQIKSVLKNSVKEIKSLSERLNTQAESLSFDTGEVENMYLPIILKDMVALKQLEYSGRPEINIEFDDKAGCSDAFVNGYSMELKSILSNLINNAIESYGSNGGKVLVKLECDATICTISVIDNGVGIPEEYLPDMGSKQISFKGNKSRGLGLTHAFKVIQSWNGEISIESKLGVGTTIELKLNKTHPNKLERSPELEVFNA